MGAFFLVHEDVAGAFYPDHAHEKLTTHIIVKGSMDLEIEGDMKTYKEGDRVDVPAGAVHNARMGPEGCRYVIGE